MMIATETYWHEEQPSGSSICQLRLKWALEIIMASKNCHEGQSADSPTHSFLGSGNLKSRVANSKVDKSLRQSFVHIYNWRKDTDYYEPSCCLFAEKVK